MRESWDKEEVIEMRRHWGEIVDPTSSPNTCPCCRGCVYKADYTPRPTPSLQLCSHQAKETSKPVSHQTWQRSSVQSKEGPSATPWSHSRCGELPSAASLPIDGTSTHGPRVSPPRKGSVNEGPGYPAQGLVCSSHMLEPMFRAFRVCQDVSYVTCTSLSFLGRGDAHLTDEITEA